MFYMCIVVVLSVSPTHGLRAVPQYARDFSEHCKRRDALPSVFLSRRAMEADAQVLHFTRLDAPYSCFTTVRTESGHSIIMVLDLYFDVSDSEACKAGNQVEVFDFGETFGGYWGPIPDAILEQDPFENSVHTKQYTLRTKPLPVTYTTPEENSSSTYSEFTIGSGSSTPEPQSFISIEVPLVNISASLLTDDKSYEKPFDPDEFFDLFYDVMPRPEQSYQTSILPLVQIAVKKQDSLREGEDGGEPRYELEYGLGPFTPDHRLTTPAWSTKINTNRNINRWKKKKLPDKRVEFRKNNSLHTKEPAKSRKFFRKQYSLPTTIHRTSYEPIMPPQAINENKYETKEPFNLINNIMKSLNESGDLKTQEESTPSDILAVLNMSEKSNHNLSVYLAPYPTISPVNDFPVNITKIPSEVPLEGTTEGTLWVSTGDKSEEGVEKYKTERPIPEHNTKTDGRKYGIEHSDNTLEGIVMAEKLLETTSPENKTDTIKLAALTHADATANQITIGHGNDDERERVKFRAAESVTDAVLVSMTTVDKRTLSGTLVDHESWENVVQSAPVMAGLLNQHSAGHSAEPGHSHDLKEIVDVASQKRQGRYASRFRRKRHIKVIDVGARPHHRPTTRARNSGPNVFNAIDMHEFARLMEVPDDQMNNHVIIKLHPNKSHQLFDICQESNWSKSRFLVLFNSSRIILSISNFSMPHVMVVLTTARPLAQQESQCSATMVECQVEGTRVCIDQTNSCDGIPNCGSAFAYDEDRVLCGMMQQHHNVYLAAVTCLAVLVTMLYVVHYWLQKCVPGVAQAFFVYTDSADNELYLDTIMRSPMDLGNAEDYIYNSALFDDETLYTHELRPSTNIFNRFFSAFFTICSRPCKKRKISSESLRRQARLSLSEGLHVNECPLSDTAKRDKSIAEKKDQEIQTGESLEMAYLKAMNSLKKDTPERKPLRLTQRPQSIHEIELRDFLGSEMTSSLDTSTDSPGPSAESAGLTVPSIDNEREIKSTLYDPGTGKIIKRDILKTSRKGGSGGRKCLRFNDNTTFIPRQDEEDDEDTVGAPEASTSRRKASISYIPSRKSGKRLQHKTDDNVEHGGGGSDFRNFFRKKKNNK